ncbi:MAG TPA: allantoinase AllB [Flexivirga sp.]|uniref:allantoinase AllB n=1 Tax=Flexivirga sp. TaxID=1962927 RepID=UPI002BD3DFCD|nr:allantoinase AllB [Flexivirga sp.]HWC24147.1 allantoinase AllB [Flexivirga sp.]
MTESDLLAPVNRPDVVRQQIADFVAAHGDPRSTEAESAHSAGGIDLVIRGARVLVDGQESPREVAIAGGRIAAIEPLGTGLQAPTVVDLGADEVLMAGVVDAHVHVNEPGRTEWEGFATATRAAAAGGVTTIIDMPLNSIPSTVTVPALDYKRMVASGQVSVDVGFWGGAVPGNRDELRGLHDEGVFGFKCFLLDSGVDEFPPLTPDALQDYLTTIAEFDGLMIVHAEDAATIGGATPPHGTRYADFLNSRPRDAESLAIAQVIEAARQTGARAHILHLSSSDALPALRAAKQSGVDITAETCPHYLTLSAEDVPGGGTAYKCCPPIREGANRELLWDALADGTIDYIASDHSPSTVELKDLEHGDFGTAWGGIASVQLALPAVWTEARRRGISLASVSEWMTSRPAERIGLRHKGKLAVGYDADLAILAPDEEFVVDAGKLQHKNPVSAYDGKTLTGVVRHTFVRGAAVDGDKPAGRLLVRGTD